MRNLHKKLLAYLLSCIMLFSLLIVSPVAEMNTNAAEKSSDKKACWISFLDIEEILQDKTEKDFRTNVSAMYDNVVKYGMNTVIVHVRALGDAMYPSNYYPWAEYFTTNRNDPGYDPLQIMIELAHKKNLQFEAWINPYRLSRDNESTVSFKITPYYKLFLPYTIEYKAAGNQTCLALDPARQETRDLITNGVKEIVSNYDVDGIHFDDYFYVSGMADQLDVVSRKNYVNALISQVYETIKSIKPNCTFGISPAGNPDNARTQGADIDTWLSTPGYIDYIMPQIYWTDVYVTKSGAERMFTNRCKAWLQINKRDIPLYVGLALYRVGTTSNTDLGWSTSDTNLSYQYVTAKQLGYDGYALFRYQWLENDIAVGELNHLRTIN
ncbi:MAG: family 10 glycosylhydrolase [Lachnospiraceae bacterium]|nr:family 10 glycosylhydrolase [Lachnospiraceae bacterium]